MLLVDSEGPVEAATKWEHLKKRGNWGIPDGADEDSVHLMVQCMEAWFLTDRKTLRKFFGHGFHEGALPDNPNPEAVPKADILDGLHNATRRCGQNRCYAKGGRSFEILGRLDAAKVKQLPRFQSLCDALEAKLQTIPD